MGRPSCLASASAVSKSGRHASDRGSARQAAIGIANAKTKIRQTAHGNSHRTPSSSQARFGGHSNSPLRPSGRFIPEVLDPANAVGAQSRRRTQKRPTEFEIKAADDGTWLRSVAELGGFAELAIRDAARLAAPSPSGAAAAFFAGASACPRVPSKIFPANSPHSACRASCSRNRRRAKNAVRRS